MYAIIETGGKQYRVEQGDVIDIERVGADDSGKVEFDRVLMIGGDEARMGTPAIDGARVTGTLMGEVRGPKIRVFKMKRRKQYRRTNGHRQDLHRVRIDEIAV